MVLPKTAEGEAGPLSPGANNRYAGLTPKRTPLSPDDSCYVTVI